MIAGKVETACIGFSKKPRRQDNGEAPINVRDAPISLLAERIVEGEAIARRGLGHGNAERGIAAFILKRVDKRLKDECGDQEPST